MYYINIYIYGEGSGAEVCLHADNSCFKTSSICISIRLCPEIAFMQTRCSNMTEGPQCIITENCSKTCALLEKLIFMFHFYIENRNNNFSNYEHHERRYGGGNQRSCCNIIAHIYYIIHIRARFFGAEFSANFRRQTNNVINQCAASLLDKIILTIPISEYTAPEKNKNTKNRR